MAADPFTFLSDDAVLELARDALKLAAERPAGDGRDSAWRAFDAAMGELDKRAVRHVLNALRARDGKN